MLRAVVRHFVTVAGEVDRFLLCVLRGVGCVAGDRGGDLRRPAGEVVAFVGGYGGGFGGGGAVCKFFGYDVAVVVLVFQVAVGALLIGNGVLVLLPDGVEVVALVAADAGGGACAEGGGGVVWGRRPTLEGVARPLRQVVYLVIVEDGDLLVVSHLIDLIGRIVVAFEVRVVGHGVLLGGEDVVCGEGDVRHPDFKALAGVVDVAIVIRPVGKYLAGRDGEAARESAHFRMREVDVGIVILDVCASAPTGLVGHRVGHAAIDGEDLGIGAQRLVDIDAIALRIHPAEEVKVFVFDIRHRVLICLRIGDGVAHGDLGVEVRLPFDLHVDGDVHGLLLPVGVEHQILGGHGGVRKVKRLCIRRDIRRLDQIPALERGVCAETIGTRRRLSIIRNRSLISDAIRVRAFVVVDQLQVVGFALVIEVGFAAVVEIKPISTTVPIPAAFALIVQLGKARDGEVVLVVRQIKVTRL